MRVNFKSKPVREEVSESDMKKTKWKKGYECFLLFNMNVILITSDEQEENNGNNNLEVTYFFFISAFNVKMVIVSMI